MGFLHLGTARASVIWFAGKIQCKPLHRTCFPGETLSETSYSRSLLADPYSTSSLTDHRCSWLQPQMWEGLKLKVEVRLEKNLFMNWRATAKLYAWTKPRYLTVSVRRRWVWVCRCSMLIWNKDRCLIEHLFFGKRKKQQLLKGSWMALTRLVPEDDLKLCCL